LLGLIAYVEFNSRGEKHLIDQVVVIASKVFYNHIAGLQRLPCLIIEDKTEDCHMAERPTIVRTQSIFANDFGWVLQERLAIAIVERLKK
jgi:hypothetical protein